MAESSPYAILGVSPDADDFAIRAAYRALMSGYNPDNNRVTETAARTVEIKAAYVFLRDRQMRVGYDTAWKTNGAEAGFDDRPMVQAAEPRINQLSLRLILGVAGVMTVISTLIY